MVKLNRGEWSEPYVALKLLADGKLFISDEDGRPKFGEWMDVLALIRYETLERMVSYDRDAHDMEVTVSVDGAEVIRLPVIEFLEAADELLADIKTGKGATFEVSESIMDFFQKIQMHCLKAKSIDKSDIFLTTLDPRAGIVRTNIGFSIKSKFGQNPTLFNTARASGVRYRLDGATQNDMDEINAMFDNAGHAAVAERCKAILERGIQPIYVGFAKARRTGEESFKENLDLIDPRLPLMVERMLWNHFFEFDASVDIPDVVARIVQENPQSLNRPEVKYPFMFKAFLYAAYCGMTASTLWDGTSDVNGGFITVDETGLVLAHYALESEEFKGYLYNNCYLEFPSTSEKHGDYAKVYEENGEYYFNLNFQIRYR